MMLKRYAGFLAALVNIVFKAWSEAQKLQIEHVLRVVISSVVSRIVYKIDHSHFSMQEVFF